MHAVVVQNLAKSFRTKVKRPGLGSGFRGLIRPEYRNVVAVDDLSFEIDEGEVLAFIGPNGAGKSTTIKLITGILYPDSGSVSVLGLDPHRARKKLAYRIGTVFGQKSQLWFHLPAIDSFRLLGDIYDVPKDTIQKRIAKLTEVFELGDYIDTPVRKLSLGQRIRCEIAASLLHEPRILFLDEPTIGLDVVVKQRIRDLIRTINEESRVTIFLTSHDAGDIEKICRRAIVINNGQTVWDGSIKDLKYAYLNKRVIAVKTETPVRTDFEGVTVLKRRDYAAKLEIDLNRVGLETIISKIIQANKIQDITITNPPMEEIITDIYSTRKSRRIDSEEDR